MNLFEFLRPILQEPTTSESGDILYGKWLYLSEGVVNVILALIFTIFVIAVTAIILVIVRKIIFSRMAAKIKKDTKIKEDKSILTTNIIANEIKKEKVEDAAYDYVDIKKRSLTIAKTIYNLVKTVILIIAVIIILDSFGINVVPIITGAGIVGLALAFGAQELVKDFISGIFNIIENVYALDELVEINGYFGTVKEIGLRTTKIQGPKGDYYILNNGRVDSVINYSRANQVAVVEIAFALTDDVKQIYAALIDFTTEFGNSHPDQVGPVSVSGLNEITDIKNVFRITAPTLPAKQFGFQRLLRLEVTSYMTKRGFNVPRRLTESLNQD